MKNYVKRILSLMLLASMMLSFIPQTHAFAVDAIETDASIQIEEVTAIPGSTVEVDISVVNNPGIYSIEFQVGFDSEYLTLTKVEYNASFGGSGMAPPLGSTFSISWYNNLKVENVHTNGVLATLTFDVSENAPDGARTEISIVPGSQECYNADDIEVPLAFSNGGITVQKAIPGDINGDRKVTTRDVTRLHQYVVGWDVTVDLKAIDVNGDGKVTTRDVTRLHQYVVGWDVDIYYDGVSNKCDHTLQAIPAQSATCIEPGNTAYWYCSTCSKYFSDAEATTEIAYVDTIITATGHTEVVDEAIEPSCSKTGLTEGSHCSVCNEVLVAQVEVDKTNHTPGAQATCTKDQICTVCSEVLATANGHVPGVEASCIEPQRCTVCQTVLTEPTGHNLTYVEEREPVNANDPGNCAYWQCSICHNCYLDEEATREISLADTAWKTYLVYFFDLENGTYTVGAYKQSEVLSLKNISPDDMKGYDFNGWHTSENFTEENKISVIPAGNTENVNLYANRSLHEYNITLLGLGREESWSYNIVNGIKLTTPKWKESAGGGDCLIFSHWEDEDGNEIKEIPAGEIGDRTIKANWIYKENYAISNNNKYTYVSGTIDQYGRYSFIYEIGAIKNIVLSKQHAYTFDGLIEHTETKTRDYTVGESAGQEAAKTISKIVSSSTEMTNIESHTTTHTDGWELGAKWKPEVELEGLKVSAWEFSGGYSNSDTDTYENTGFSSEKNYEENGTEDEIRSTIDYYTEESISRTVSDTFVPGVTPIGNYTWARLMDVKVYAIVTYNPYTGNYVFDIYSVPTNVQNGLLFTLPSELEYEINIVSGDVLDFEIPFEEIPEMFYTVEYEANGGTGEMHKSVHELGVSSTLLPKSYILKEGEAEKTYGYTKAGYTFAGWKTTADGDTALYTDASSIRDIAAAGETVTLYAHWIKNAYTVQYDANKPSNASASVLDVPSNTDCSYDTAVTLGSAPSLTGWTFDGWYREADCTNRVGSAGEIIANANLTTKPDVPVTLCAKWTANTYTVTYNANGGTGTTNQSTHTYDTAKVLSSNGFSRSNHTFMGWSTDSSALIPTYTNAQSVKNLTLRGNITLYAVWVKTAYSASWDKEEKLEENDSYEQTISPGFNKQALLNNGYTKVTLKLTFTHEETNAICFNDGRVQVYSNDGSVSFADETWDPKASEKTYELSVGIDITNLGSDGSFKIKYSTPSGKGSSSDGWYMRDPSVEISAS